MNVLVLRELEKDPSASVEWICEKLGLTRLQVKGCIHKAMAAGLLKSHTTGNANGGTLKVDRRLTEDGTKFLQKGVWQIPSKPRLGHKGERKMRRCLMGGGYYLSEGPGDRICKNCKQKEAYRAA